MRDDLQGICDRDRHQAAVQDRNSRAEYLRDLYLPFLMLALVACASTPSPTAFPRFVNHTPLQLVELVIDLDALDTLPSGQYLEPDSASIDQRLGSQLSYEILTLATERSDELDCRFRPVRHPRVYSFCYAISGVDKTAVVNSEDDLREVFAPIDTVEEALLYAYLVANGRGQTDGPILA